MRESISITNGPDFDAVMKSLFDREFVDFTTSTGTRLSGVINQFIFFNPVDPRNENVDSSTREVSYQIGLVSQDTRYKIDYNVKTLTGVISNEK